MIVTPNVIEVIVTTTAIEVIVTPNVKSPLIEPTNGQVDELTISTSDTG